MIVTGAVLASAVLHAVWNALAHRSADPAAAVVLIHVGLAVLSLPLLFVAPVPAPAARPYLAVALVLHLIYVVLLARCYRIGDFGQVYPLARGSAPLVVAALAVGLAGERLSWVGLAGVVVVCAGLAVLVGAGLHRLASPAVVAAGATGLVIAGYTVVDGLGVRHAGTTVGYTLWLLGLHGLTVVGYALLLHGRSLVGVVRRGWWLAVVGGTLGWASYALVLWAQTRGALAAVAALRETSVVAAAIIGTIVFGERFGRRRITATLLVATGIVLLNL